MPLSLDVSLRPRRTLLVTVCAGLTAPGCGAELAHRFVPWRGTPLIESHGICQRCRDREEIASLMPRPAAGGTR